MYVCWWTQGNKERNKTKLEAIHISLKPNRLLVTGSEFLSLLSKVMPAWEIYRQTHTTQSWVMTAIWSVRQTFEWEATEGCGFVHWVRWSMQCWTRSNAQNKRDSKQACVRHWFQIFGFTLRNLCLDFFFDPDHRMQSHKEVSFYLINSKKGGYLRPFFLPHSIFVYWDDTGMSCLVTFSVSLL